MPPTAHRSNTAADHTETPVTIPSWTSSPRERTSFLRDMSRRDLLYSYVSGLRTLFLNGTANVRGKIVVESEFHVLFLVNFPDVRHSWSCPSPTTGYTATMATVAPRGLTSSDASPSADPDSAPPTEPSAARGSRLAYDSYADIPSDVKARYTIDIEQLREIDRSGCNQIGAWVTRGC